MHTPEPGCSRIQAQISDGSACQRWSVIHFTGAVGDARLTVHIQHAPTMAMLSAHVGRSPPTSRTTNTRMRLVVGHHDSLMLRLLAIHSVLIEQGQRPFQLMRSSWIAEALDELRRMSLVRGNDMRVDLPR